MERTSLSYIFFTFLKLGATAFGGYMSLVAIVQKQLVEVDKKLKEEDLLDGISLIARPCSRKHYSLCRLSVKRSIWSHCRFCRNHPSFVFLGNISFVAVFLLRKYPCGEECIQWHHSSYYRLDCYGGYRYDAKDY